LKFEARDKDVGSYDVLGQSNNLSLAELTLIEEEKEHTLQLFDRA